jgi:hypothetical protein
MSVDNYNPAQYVGAPGHPGEISPGRVLSRPAAPVRRPRTQGARLGGLLYKNVRQTVQSMNA